MNESKKITAMLRAKREFLEKAFLVISFAKVMKILKWSVFRLLIPCLVRLKLMIKGLKKSQLFLEGVPMIQRWKPCWKFDKSGIGEVKTLTSDVPTLLDYEDFNYDICSLIECISLLQSMLNSPNAYEQNKAMMNDLEEKLEL